jgi:hypothetical protein
MMRWSELVMHGAGLHAAFPSSEALATTYFPLALLAVLLTVFLIKAVRLWQEIHEVDEPVTPGDLLASFEQAHAAGELNDDEFRKVREQLAGGPSGATKV